MSCMGRCTLKDEIEQAALQGGLAFFVLCLRKSTGLLQFLELNELAF